MSRLVISVQCLRGIAASAVALSHLVIFEAKYLDAPAVFPTVFKFGMAGVDLFFVISGFIICTVTKGQFEKREATTAFLSHRFIRIYPIYWFYFFLVLAVFFANPGMVNSSYGRPDLLTSFLLLPDKNPPLLAVAWTLVHEVFFYLVFALALRFLAESQVVAFLVIWAVFTIAGVIVFRPDETWPFLNLLFNPLTLEFILGCFLARFVSLIGGAAAGACVVVAVLLLLGGPAALHLMGASFPEGWTRVLLFGIGSGCLIAGCVSMEMTGRVRRFPRALVVLGDASYSLYLSHVLTISAVGYVWMYLFSSSHPANHVIALVAAAIATVVWALISYWFIESPLLRWLRNMTDRRRQLAPTEKPAVLTDSR